MALGPPRLTDELGRLRLLPWATRGGRAAPAGRMATVAWAKTFDGSSAQRLGLSIGSFRAHSDGSADMCLAINCGGLAYADGPVVERSELSCFGFWAYFDGPDDERPVLRCGGLQVIGNGSAHDMQHAQHAQQAKHCHCCHRGHSRSRYGHCVKH